MSDGVNRENDICPTCGGPMDGLHSTPEGFEFRCDVCDRKAADDRIIKLERQLAAHDHAAGVMERELKARNDETLALLAERMRERDEARAQLEAKDRECDVLKGSLTDAIHKLQEWTQEREQLLAREKMALARANELSRDCGITRGTPGHFGVWPEEYDDNDR